MADEKKVKAERQLSIRVLTRLAILLASGYLLMTLFVGGDKDRARDRGIVQILPADFYYIYDGEDRGAKNAREWHVDFTLPIELQIDGQTNCGDLISLEQYLALRSIKPLDMNGGKRFVPVWIHNDESSRKRYLCDLNVNGVNFPWQVPEDEVDAINLNNRTKTTALNDG